MTPAVLKAMALKARIAAAEVRYSGRGGAGNYNTSAETEGARALEAETQAKEARSKAFEQLVRDVEMGLKPPERAHLMSERALWMPAAYVGSPGS